MGVRSLADIDFDSKGGVKNSNETIDYSQSAEPTLNTSKTDTLNGHLSYFAKGFNWLRDNLLTSSVDAILGKVTATKFVKSNGTSSQFLKADGSVDSNSYATLNEEGEVERAILADDLGGREETREEQFTYQATAGDESVKDGLAIVKSIKGNTVVANQLFKKNLHNPIPGISVTYDNGKFTVNGTTGATNSVYLDKDYTQYKQGDKVLILYPHNKPNPYGGFLAIRSGSKFYHCPNNVDAYIVTITETEELRPVFICLVNEPYEDIQFSLQIVNLTQMFGTGNEPTSVEEFERLYPNLPKEYNAGSLLNLNADSIKSVGFNQFDKNTVQRGAYIHPTTLEVISYPELEESVSSYIRVIPNETYYVENAISGYDRTIVLYDKDKKIAGRMLLPHGSTIDKKYLAKGLITIPENVYYIRFGVYNEYLDSCVFNLFHSGYRNGEYEPYKESIVNLPIKKYFPDGMKSAGEVRDEIVWDESIKKYKSIQRVGSVDMGTLVWVKGAISQVTNTPIFYTAVIFNRKWGNTPLRTTKYIYNLNYYPQQISSGQINGNHHTNIVYIVDSDYTDVAAFKQSLQGQILYYELETPIETIIDDYDLIDYEVSDFGTEEIIADEPTTPIIADIQYGFNAVDEIRNHRFEIKDIKKQVQMIDSEVVEKLAPVATSGDYNDLSNKPTIPTYEYVSAKQDDSDLGLTTSGEKYVWDNKQNAISDLSTIRTNATNGATAYGWGNHASAGYASANNITSTITIDNTDDWFVAGCYRYVLPTGMVEDLLSGNINIVELFEPAQKMSCELTAYDIEPRFVYDLSTPLIKAGYNVYVENDIDDMITNGGSCAIKFKIDGINVIIECYKKIV